MNQSNSICADVFFLDALRISENRRETRVNAKSPWYIYYSLPSIHQSIIYSRSVYEKYRYDTSFRICGDYAFTAAMYRDGCSCVAIPALFSKFHMGGASSVHKDILASEARRIQQQYLNMPSLFAHGFGFIRKLRHQLL